MGKLSMKVRAAVLFRLHLYVFNLPPFCLSKKVEVLRKVFTKTLRSSSSSLCSTFTQGQSLKDTIKMKMLISFVLLLACFSQHASGELPGIQMRLTKKGTVYTFSYKKNGLKG